MCSQVFFCPFHFFASACRHSPPSWFLPTYSGTHTRYWDLCCYIRDPFLPYLLTMKILVAYRQWRRPRHLRKRFSFHRRPDKPASSTLLINSQPQVSSRRSIEKLIYDPELVEIVEIVELKSALPPAYDECVNYAPPLHPPPPPSPSAGTDKERGRPRELLYKLQLNDMMMRRPKGPSPAARKTVKPKALDVTNYRELSCGQARACSWEQGMEMIKWATVMWLAFTCVMLAFT